MNPYHFVRVDWDEPPERHAPSYHEKFNGLSGEIYGEIVAKTPIFIPRRGTGGLSLFIKNKNQKYIIPGSSLKGLIRNLVETVGNGCFLLLNKNYTNRIPNGFTKCSQARKLCIACRMFGTIQGSDVFKGKVSFNDAVETEVSQHAPIHTVDLMGPKPQHSAFYLDAGQIAGRKFYYHHVNGIRTSNHGTNYNQHIKPLDAGSKFDFSIQFTNLEEQELKTLLYALVLEPNMRHKLGYAKPSGFGSVKIDLTKIRLIDYKIRYTPASSGISGYQGTRLNDYVNRQIGGFVNSNSITLNDLRDIWLWDENDTTTFRYPSQDWFAQNPNAPIGDTP